MTMVPPHGAKLGARIAAIVTEAIIATQHKMRDIKHGIAMRVFHVISDEISAETQYVLGPTLEALLQDPDLHPAMRPHIEFLARTPGQLSAMAGTALSASGILASIALIMNNRLMPQVAAQLSSDPNMPPDPGTLAGIEAKGIQFNKDNVSWMAGQGIDGFFAAEMIEANRQYPSPADALDMLRKGHIDNVQFAKAIKRNAIPDEFLPAWISMRDIPVSVADAALAVLRGNMTQAEGQRVASEWGYDEHSFAILVGNTGEPPGLMQLLEAYRRGFIDKATLEKGILQSRYRNEWIPVLEKLRYSPMSVADAVAAVVQNHIPMAEGQLYASQNGLDPAAFPVLYQTAGQPLSRTELEQLYNRGEITLAEVEQGLRESHLKDKYVADAVKLHQRLLEPRMLSSAVANGVMTKPEAIKHAMDYGFSAKDAEFLVSEATAAKLRTYRQRELSALESLYERNAISETDVVDMAKSLGYDQDEITALVKAAEFRREELITATAINVAKSKYLAHHMKSADVATYLTTLGIPSPQIDTLLGVWTLERSAYTRELSEAQVIHAMKKQVITPDDAMTRLTDMGYSQDDAAILIEGA